jgi:hypothetical protein
VERSDNQKLAYKSFAIVNIHCLQHEEAKVVLFLASDNSSSITGIELFVEAVWHKSDGRLSYAVTTLHRPDGSNSTKAFDHSQTKPII